MPKTSSRLFAFRTVFSSWNYIFLAFGVALAFYFLNLAISSIGNFAEVYRSLGLTAMLAFIGKVSVHFLLAMPTYNAVGLVALAILTGCLISMLSFKFSLRDTSMKSSGTLNSAALFLGMVAPGCASCGIGLIALFGLSSSLATLPFKGFEVSMLAIALMGIALYKVSGSLLSCNPTHKSERRSK